MNRLRIVLITASALALFSEPTFAAPNPSSDGYAMIECTVTDSGGLTQCVVITETPKGQGYGAAALKAAESFHMKLTTTNGNTVTGARVRVPIRWKLDNDGKPIGPGIAPSQGAPAH